MSFKIPTLLESASKFSGKNQNFGEKTKFSEKKPEIFEIFVPL